MTTFEKVILGAAAFTEEMCLLVGGDRDGHAVIIRAYFDESGVHVGAPVTAVAAYFAEAKSWKAFTRRWLNTLRQFGVAEFHMNDYAQRHCAFDGWTSEKQRALGE